MPENRVIYTPDNSARMIAATARVYGFHAVDVETRTCHVARLACPESPPVWNFMAGMHDDTPVGFWFPDTELTLDVTWPDNFFEGQMGAMTAGAAFTRMALNHHIWLLHGAGRDVDALITTQDALESWLYEQADILDLTAIYRFLD